MSRVAPHLLANHTLLKFVWCCVSATLHPAVACSCVQIQRLLLSFPKTSHGYQYIFISVVTAVVLGLIIYGIPVWTLVL